MTKKKSDKDLAVKEKAGVFSIQERLVKGEEVLVQAEIHWGIYWRAIAVFIFSLIVALVFAIELGILLAVVSVLMGSYAIALKNILLMVVTNKRIFSRYGILQVDVVDVHFDKIESIELERMLPGYLFGYSNVVVMGTGNRYIVIPFVSNGVELRRAYNEITLSDEEKEMKA